MATRQKNNKDRITPKSNCKFETSNEVPSNENEVSYDFPQQNRDPFNSLDWYHGDIPQNWAEAMLNIHKKDISDSFLLRSEVVRGEKRYSLNALSCEKVWQFEIKYNSETNIIQMGQKSFNSVEEFETHLLAVRIKCADGLSIHLKNPIRVIHEPSFRDNIYYHVIGSSNKRSIYKDMPFSRTLTAPNEYDKSKLHATLNSYSGFLVKQGHRVKNWKKRFFVLKDGKLSYYTYSNSKRPKNTLNFSDLVKLEKKDHYSCKKQYCFTLTFKGNYCLRVQAECKEEYDKWLLRITNALPLTFRGIVE